MFGIIKFFFWIALITTVIYFSGDLKFKDKSLRDWASEWWQEDLSKKVETNDVVEKIKELLDKEDSTGLTKEQADEVKHLIDERLSKTDKESLNKLMKQISESSKENGSNTSTKTNDEKKK